MTSRQQQIREAKQRRIQARERFIRARKAVRVFGRQLTQVAKQVGNIVTVFAPGGVVKDPAGLHESLARYSDLLQPWAESVSEQLVAEVAQRDQVAWIGMGRELGRELRKEVEQAPIKDALRAMMQEQVDLITSLPTKAAERVHKLTMEAALGGPRAREVAKEIARTGKVTESRAMLIARTETSRTVSAITATRAQFIGCEGYIWRTSMDGDVRELHRKLEGKFIRWDDPPVAGENGERAHAGAIYNCRCHMEPVLPDTIT